MRKFPAFVVVLAFATGLAILAQPQAKPDPKQDNQAASNISGKWTMTLEMSMGTGTPTLELKQDGEKVTGTYTGRYGTFDLQGKLKDRAIAFSFVMTAEGESVTMTFNGEVAKDGQSMKGTATMGEMGDATWNAKKEKSVP